MVKPRRMTWPHGDLIGALEARRRPDGVWDATPPRDLTAEQIRAAWEKMVGAGFLGATAAGEGPFVYGFDIGADDSMTVVRTWVDGAGVVHVDQEYPWTPPHS